MDADSVSKHDIGTMHPDIDFKRDLWEMIPLTYHELLNERGQVVYHFHQSFGSIIFGSKRYKRVVDATLGNPVFLQGLMFSLTVSGVLFFLGLMKLVPAEVFIANMCFMYAWSAFIFGTFDSRIYRNIVRSFGNLVYYPVTVAVGVLFALLCGWDYRGICFLLYFSTNALLQIGMDAQPYYLRTMIIPALSQYILAVLVCLMLIYFGFIPDIDFELILFGIELEQKTGIVSEIQFSVLSLFTEMFIINMTFMCRELYVRFSGPKPLSYISIRLEGVDESGFRSLEHFKTFLPKRWHLEDLGEIDNTPTSDVQSDL